MTWTDLSPLQRHQLQDRGNGSSNEYKAEKLLTELNGVTNYRVHSHLLELYVQLGKHSYLHFTLTPLISTVNISSQLFEVLKF